MNLPFPQSFPCRFDGFPDAIDIRMGKSGSEIIPGDSWGTKYLLTQTPKSGVPQGDYIVGQPLPSYRKIYSDTGDDTSFTIKVSFIGEGSFYRFTNSDSYLRFQIFKAIILETADCSEMMFGGIFDCETLIPASINDTSLFDYSGASISYIDVVNDSSGSFVFNGNLYTLSNGQSVVITDSLGETNTYTVVNGVLVVSGG